MAEAIGAKSLIFFIMINPINPLPLNNNNYRPQSPPISHGQGVDGGVGLNPNKRLSAKSSRLDSLPEVGHLRVSGPNSLHKSLHHLVYHNPEFENFADNLPDVEKVLSRKDNMLKVNHLGGFNRLDRLKLIQQLRNSSSVPLTRNDKSDFKKILKHFSRD